MLRQLVQVPGLEIGVAMRSPVGRLGSERIEGIRYFAMPQSRTDPFDVSEEDCHTVLREFNPDLLHAEGSEMAYTRRFLRNWTGRKILSLQGVINGYEPYELGRLRIGQMIASLRVRDAVTAAVLLMNKRLRFDPRLPVEAATIQSVDAVLGRTLWDRAHAYALNPRARYFSCNRVLRSEFYDRQWNSRERKQFSLFMGNAAAPRKGAHILVRAVAALKEEYPEIRLCIAGDPPIRTGRDRWKGVVGYGGYLLRLIRRLGIEQRVEFLGTLGANEMAERMRLSHVAVVSSLIENSPNTLAEAMMMGVPAVAAFAGGVPSMAADEVDALFYRPDDWQYLAYQIKRLFDDEALCERLSQAAQRRARVTHDPQRNLQLLLDAYRSVTGNLALEGV